MVFQGWDKSLLPVVVTVSSVVLEDKKTAPYLFFFFFDVVMPVFARIAGVAVKQTVIHVCASGDAGHSK